MSRTPDAERGASSASRPPGWQLYETETASVQPAVAYCRAQLASMHAGKELLALGSAHGNPHDGFPARAVLGSAARSVMPDGPELPAQARTTTSAARTRAHGIGRMPLKVIWRFPGGPGSPGLCWENRQALSK